MKLHAYVLAGDPAWATRSLSSYYRLVDRIVVAFDAGFRSWSGQPLSVPKALEALQAADPDHKIELLPGDFSDRDRPILEVETAQRQAALAAAGQGCDWVLQFDTDEILLSPSTFLEQLTQANARAADALDFPLRDFYQFLGRRNYLEHCSRTWRNQAAYPGPLAVRSGSELTHCRQMTGGHYRVDMSWRNTDPWHPWDAPVHAVIEPSQAVMHMSWVRTDSEMAEKSKVAGYSGSKDWGREIRLWKWRRKHPILTASLAPVSRPLERFRISTLPLDPAY